MVEDKCVGESLVALFSRLGPGGVIEAVTTDKVKDGYMRVTAV